MQLLHISAPTDNSTAGNGRCLDIQNHIARAGNNLYIIEIRILVDSAEQALEVDKYCLTGIGRQVKSLRCPIAVYIGQVVGEKCLGCAAVGGDIDIGVSTVGVLPLEAQYSSLAQADSRHTQFGLAAAARTQLHGVSTALLVG